MFKNQKELNNCLLCYQIQSPQLQNYAKEYINNTLSKYINQKQEPLQLSQLNYNFNQKVVQDVFDAMRVDRSACTKIVTDLENLIAYHTAQVSANAQMKEDNEKALAEAETDVRQIIQDIESNEKTYAQEEANRNKAHETWVRKKQ